MQNKKEYQDLSLLYESIYEEGILSRTGARIAGAKAAGGQYFKNIGKTLTGKAAPVSAKDASKLAKTQYTFKSAALSLLKDLQKLGLLPKGPIPSKAELLTIEALGDLVDVIRQEPVSNDATGSNDYDPFVDKEHKQAFDQKFTSKPPTKVKSKKTKTKAPTASSTEDGFKPVGSSGKQRKVYSQSDEEPIPMPSSFNYFN